jgi:CMP-N,N'-diacetyllegionaminic acid synthase
MAFVGLIPARGGSKGIPRKNITPCAGKPLIAWTCEAARASRALDRVILSTDSEEIAAVGRACGVEVPFLRPARLAEDSTPALPVICHAFGWLERAGELVEGMVLLQPTSPLRRARHIDEAVELFRRRRADTVVSVVRIPHRCHPASVMRERAGRLVPYLEDEKTVTRRQELETLYARNGPAVLVLSPSTLRAKRLYGGNTVGYEMNEPDSIDIDTEWDLHLAELVLRHRDESEGSPADIS